MLQGLTDHHEGSAMQGLTPQNRNLLSRALVLSPPIKCVSCGWVVLQQGLKLSSRCTGSESSKEMKAKVSCHLCLAQTTSMSYKVICRCLVLVLGLEVAVRGKAMNQGRLLLGLGLGQLSKRYGACQSQMVLV